MLYFLQVKHLVNLIPSSIKMVDPKEVGKYLLIANGNHSVMRVAIGRLNFIASWEELASGAKKIQKDDIVVSYVATNCIQNKLHHATNVLSLIYNVIFCNFFSKLKKKRKILPFCIISQSTCRALS